MQTLGLSFLRCPCSSISYTLEPSYPFFSFKDLRVQASVSIYCSWPKTPSRLSGLQLVLSQDPDFRPSSYLLRPKASPTGSSPPPVFWRVSLSAHPFPFTWWCSRTLVPSPILFLNQGDQHSSLT